MEKSEKNMKKSCIFARPLQIVVFSGWSEVLITKSNRYLIFYICFLKNSAAPRQGSDRLL
jgi:hypothetical protein